MGVFFMGSELQTMNGQNKLALWAERVSACQTLDVSSETKTLGGQTANESYYGQYEGQDSSLSGVQAISGATITSTAYKGCVQTAFAAYETVKEAAK